jgi:hypothetical protein
MARRRTGYSRACTEQANLSFSSSRNVRRLGNGGRGFTHRASAPRTAPRKTRASISRRQSPWFWNTAVLARLAILLLAIVMGVYAGQMLSSVVIREAPARWGLQ